MKITINRRDSTKAKPFPLRVVMEAQRLNRNTLVRDARRHK